MDSIDGAVKEFTEVFGCSPMDTLADPFKRDVAMELALMTPDSEGVRRRLDALRIARTSGHLMPVKPRT